MRVFFAVRLKRPTTSQTLGDGIYPVNLRLESTQDAFIFAMADPGLVSPMLALAVRH